MAAANTRERLLTAALQLMSVHGYESTTAAQIAARAGVTEMTFFRHFPTKASVIIDDPYDPLIAEAIRRRPSGESAWESTIRGIEAAWEAVPPQAEERVRGRLAIVARTPALRAALAEGSAATVAAIANALDDRTSNADAGVIAAAIVAGLNEALLSWSGTESSMNDAIRSALRTMGRR